MNDFGKKILDDLGALMVARGLQKKRRGLFFARLNVEMTAAISFQVRSHGGRFVEIIPYYQVFWEPVERIFCIGSGRPYRYLDHPTRSQIQILGGETSPGASLFQRETEEPHKLEEMAEHVCANFERETKALADPKRILEFFRSEMKYGGGRLEQYLSVLVWTTRSTDLAHDCTEVTQLLAEGHDLLAFPTFMEELQQSSEVAQLLRH